MTVPMQIDPEAIKAEYRDGILALPIPRAERDKPRGSRSARRTRGTEPHVTTRIAGPAKARGRKKQESTVPARTFVPTTDIFESEQALTIVMEMPGLTKATSTSAWRTAF